MLARVRKGCFLIAICDPRMFHAFGRPFRAPHRFFGSLPRAASLRSLPCAMSRLPRCGKLALEQEPGSEQGTVVDGKIGGIAAEPKMAVGYQAAFDKHSPNAGRGAGAEQNAV